MVSKMVTLCLLAAVLVSAVCAHKAASKSDGEGLKFDSMEHFQEHMLAGHKRASEALKELHERSATQGKRDSSPEGVAEEIDHVIDALKDGGLDAVDKWAASNGEESRLGDDAGATNLPAEAAMHLEAVGAFDGFKGLAKGNAFAEKAAAALSAGVEALKAQGNKRQLLGLPISIKVFDDLLSDDYECAGRKPEWSMGPACNRCFRSGAFTGFNPTEEDDCILIDELEDFPGNCDDDIVLDLLGGDDCLVIDFGAAMPAKCINRKISILGGDDPKNKGSNDDVFIFASGFNNGNIATRRAIELIDLGDGDDTLSVVGSFAFFTIGTVDLGSGINGFSSILFPGGVTVENIIGGDECDLISMTGELSVGDIETNEGDDAIIIIEDPALAGFRKRQPLGPAVLRNVDSGSGDDVILLIGFSGKSIDSGAGNDAVLVAAGQWGNIATGAGNDGVVLALANVIEEVEMSSGNDRFTGVLAFVGKIEAGSGNDRVTLVLSGANGIRGGEGDDRVQLILAALGTDELNLGGGDDQAFFLLALAASDIEGQEGNDVLVLNLVALARADLEGGNGDDIINVLGALGTESDIEGGTGNDRISGTLWLSTGTIDGGSGDDDIVFTLSCLSKDVDGGSGDDTCNLTLVGAHRESGLIKSSVDMRKYAFTDCETIVPLGLIADIGICPF